MKIVIVRFSVELAIPDNIYEEMNKQEWYLNPENCPAAVALSARISSALQCKCKVEQIYDNWEEAGY